MGRAGRSPSLAPAAAAGAAALLAVVTAAAVLSPAQAQEGADAEPPVSVPAVLAALAAAEGKYAALATLQVATEPACGAGAGTSNSIVAPVGCSQVELVGSDEVALENVDPETFASGGLVHLVLRCTDFEGGFDGVYHLDSDLRTLFEDTGTPQGWRADVTTDAFLGIPLLATRLAVADAVLGVRAQDEAFATLGEPQDGSGANASEAALAGLSPVAQQLRVWGKSGAINASNDNAALGLVFDSLTPLGVAMGGSFEESKPELSAAPFIGGTGEAQLRYVADEKISIPLDAIFENIEINLPEIAVGVVDSIIESSQIDLDMRFEAFGSNPCAAATTPVPKPSGMTTAAPGPKPAPAANGGK